MGKAALWLARASLWGTCALGAACASGAVDPRPTPVPLGPGGQGTTTDDVQAIPGDGDAAATTGDGQGQAAGGSSGTPRVLPQLTSGGVGGSSSYSLSVRTGAPQPFGDGRSSSYSLAVGSGVGR